MASARRRFKRGNFPKTVGDNNRKATNGRGAISRMFRLQTIGNKVIKHAL